MMQQDQFPKITISFAPAWWQEKYGMDFGRDVWEDPVARTERDQEQRRLLFERFGDVGMGEADPQPRPLTGTEYGDRFMSAFWGCDIKYLPDQVPAAIAFPDARRKMEILELPDLINALPVQRAFEQSGILKQRFGECKSGINFGSPLNNAVSVFGEEILVACAAEPELAQWVLRKMGEAILAVYDQVSCEIDEIDPSQRHSKWFGLGNCPVCMIRPRTYFQVVLPVDMWMREQFKGAFMLHHCGIFHPYNEVYQPLKPTELDVGWGSDLRAVRSVFPELPMSTYIEVRALHGIVQEEIDALLTKLLRDAGPPELLTNISVAEVGPDIPDETVRCLMTVSERIQI